MGCDVFVGAPEKRPPHPVVHLLAAVTPLGRRRRNGMQGWHAARPTSPRGGQVSHSDQAEDSKQGHCCCPSGFSIGGEVERGGCRGNQWLINQGQPGFQLCVFSLELQVFPRQHFDLILQVVQVVLFLFSAEAGALSVLDHPLLPLHRLHLKNVGALFGITAKKTHKYSQPPYS